MSIGQGKSWKVWRNQSHQAGKIKQQHENMKERADKRFERIKEIAKKLNPVTPADSAKP